MAAKPPATARRAAAFGIDVVIAPLLPLAIAAAVLDAPGWSWLLAALALPPVVWALLVALTGTTPGKAAMGLAVARADGQPLTRADAVRRELVGRGLTHLLVCCGGAGLAGYVAGLIGPRRQAWHDSLAGTVVVPRTAVAGTDDTLAPPFAARDVAPGGASYGAYGERVGAYLIDTAFALTIASALLTPLFLAAPTRLAGENQPGWLKAAVVVIFALSSVGYQVVALALWETTIGKNAVGLVVRHIDGGVLGWRGALRRELLGRVLVVQVAGAFALGIPALLDLVWPLWDGQRQSLHDQMASTVVLRGASQRRPSFRWPGRRRPLADPSPTAG